ncbi:MAG: hypothetical protein Q4C64_03605 [Erysipelotrichia bacterium]|nr:hypothetical protein [Erysipelotrichia bacterium]
MTITRLEQIIGDFRGYELKEESVRDFIGCLVTFFEDYFDCYSFEDVMDNGGYLRCICDDDEYKNLEDLSTRDLAYLLALSGVYGMNYTLSTVCLVEDEETGDEEQIEFYYEFNDGASITKYDCQSGENIELEFDEEEYKGYFEWMSEEIDGDKEELTDGVKKRLTEIKKYIDSHEDTIEKLWHKEWFGLSYFMCWIDNALEYNYYTFSNTARKCESIIDGFEEALLGVSDDSKIYLGPAYLKPKSQPDHDEVLKRYRERFNSYELVDVKESIVENKEEVAKLLGSENKVESLLEFIDNTLKSNGEIEEKDWNYYVILDGFTKVFFD